MNTSHVTKPLKLTNKISALSYDLCEAINEKIVARKKYQFLFAIYNFKSLVYITTC